MNIGAPLRELVRAVRFSPRVRRLSWAVSLGNGGVAAAEALCFVLIYALLRRATELSLPRDLPLVLGLLGAALVRGASLFFVGHCSAIAENAIITDLRNRIFDRVQGADISYHDRTHSAVSLHSLSGEVPPVKWVITSLSSMCSQAVRMPVYVIVLVVTSWSLTLVGFAWLVIIAFSFRPLARSLADRSRQHASAHRSFITGASEWLRGIRTVHAHATGATERARFADAALGIERAAVALADVQSFQSAVAETVGVLSLAGILFIGMVVLDLPLPLVFTYQLALVRALMSLRSLLACYATLTTQYGAIRHVGELLRDDELLPSRDGTIAFPGLRECVELRDVSFAYATGSASVLDSLRLTISRGAFVALVGPSGSGKSTIAHLLLRFYRPTSGQILVDGRALDDLAIESFRRRIAIVSQDTYLFDRTVRENITYGLTDVSDAELYRAAEIAHATEFISALPRGFDTLVGERGVRLSAGQCQRVAIARAVLRDPELLILDEATSALDSISERLVQQALDHLVKGRTVLAIAHRLATVARADVIYVLESGKVVEDGSFSELVARGGAFKRFYAAQTVGAG